MKKNTKGLSLEIVGGHVRQGDVLVRRISAIPKKLQKVKPILALGETSGHFHGLDGGATCFADAPEALAEWIHVEKESTLTHQEHAPIQFPAGEYEKLYQVEDDAETARRVAD